MNDVMTDAIAGKKSANMPWLLFKILGQQYALNVKNVISIFQMVDPVTPVAQYPQCFRGIQILRDGVVPMLEMRCCLNQPTLAQEYAEFVQMLEVRKNDHINWVNRLTYCLENDEPFELAMDPHKCAFGKWYDSFDSNIDSVKYMLAKIDAPHKALHASAEEAFACDIHPEVGEREKCKNDVLDRAKNEFVPELLGLLDEAKEAMKAHYHEMCIVLSDGEKNIGLIVDEVSAVEMLEEIDVAGNMAGLTRSELIDGIAKSKNYQGEILMLSESALFGYVTGNCDCQ